MKRKLSVAVFFAAAAMLAFAASAGAVDGTIEINQAKVLANGGFPYSISTQGSYRLTGNLTPPASTDAIDVTANHVTIDLNGFSIVGAGGTGNGINGISAGALTVENGTIVQFANGYGVYTGGNGIVRNVHADSNATGIGCYASGCLISGNTVNGNGNTGVYCQGSGCAILGNTIENNCIFGINATDFTTGYGENLLTFNGTCSFGQTVNGGTTMNNNVCSTGSVTAKVC